MANFFVPNPKGNFHIFSMEHIIFLFFSAIVIIGISFLLSNSSRQKIENWLKIISITVLFFDPIYWIWEFLSFGKLHWETTLPLYFCSLFWILMPLVAFGRKDSCVHRSCLACISTFCFSCGILGMIFNIYLNRYPLFSFVPLRSMAYHFIMVLVPCVLWTSNYYQPQRKDRYLFFIPILILMVPCFIVDKFFGWDYCYLNGGKGTPFEGISSIMPNAFFIIFIYALIFILTNMIFYLPSSKRMEDNLEVCKI